ncbi:CoA transferase [Amycolatopsis rhabdoformis]|uniref:CoA transferase n=1 Tax=Amycolatopsis rhabdoformis TaxID=1448059 RepID=A0ABZ1HY65_9PSEU|nr:CoA transferase [Amycolatopsis rhabdoformis]WSE26799.1 CoA transferase [Amycolatopsis rhabdoformis]
MKAPYAGVRVLDLTQLEQGPSGTQVLADFGADVIKIERPGTGEIGRRMKPAEAGGYSSFWAANNRNKRSLSLDLKSPEGRRVFTELVKTADVVAANFRPGVMERLGFGYEDLAAINPRIILALASGYGQDGPYRDRRGQDLAAQALGGIMALTGDADGPPRPVGTYVVDYIAAMHFAQAIMAALAAREQNGVGQLVDVCLLNAAVAMHLQEGSAYLNDPVPVPRPRPNLAHSRNTALYGTYETSDGRAIVIIADIFIDEPWQRVCRALEIGDEIARDPRFATIEDLERHRDESAAVLREAFARFSRADAEARLLKEDVLCAPVQAYDEVFTDPQVLFNGMVVETEIEGVGKRRIVGQPVRLAGTPADSARLAPPRVGQHNEEILAELGLSEVEIGEVRAAGAIGDENERRSRGEGDAW